VYLDKGALKVDFKPRTTGLLERLTVMQAGQFVQVIEEPRLKIGCIEEIAWRQGFIQMRHLLH
jgi:hypothetical protein